MDVADKLLVLQNHTNPETGRKYTVRQLGATVGIPYSQISRLLTIATADPSSRKSATKASSTTRPQQSSTSTW